MSYTDIILEPHDSVLVIRLNRPKALNALCVNLMSEVKDAVEKADVDPAIGCIIIAGSEKAFAAGADIKEMQNKTFQDVFAEDFITREWEAVAKCRTPVIAAVRGYALGGGCELAMMCDIMLASDTAKFGQPEITIGTIPGAGGTQRLPRMIGKAKAMELVLTGRMMDAEEAERSGLVSRVFPDAELEDEALKTAKKIAGFSTPAVLTAKESVNRAYESSLHEGMMVERRLFHATFALEDQKEGMQAFAEKRKPVWKNR